MTFDDAEIYEAHEPAPEKPKTKKQIKLDREGSKKNKSMKFSKFFGKWGKKIVLAGLLVGILVVAPTLTPWFQLGAAHLGLTAVRVL